MNNSWNNALISAFGRECPSIREMEDSARKRAALVAKVEAIKAWLVKAMVKIFDFVGEEIG